MLPYIILACILVLSQESPPPIQVGNLEKGITIVNYDKATHGFSVDTSDHFLVQKFHEIDHFGEFPWKCTLEFENGASVEQLFKNPRLDVETFEFEEIDKIHLKFKGVFGEEKVLKCYEETSRGTFEQVIYSDNHVVMEVGVGGSSSEQTEIRWYQKACESEAMETMGCEDNYFVMPVVGDGYSAENKEEFFTKAIEAMDFLLSVEPYKKYRSWFHIPMVWGEPLRYRNYFGTGTSCDPSTSTLTNWLEDHGIFSDVITLFSKKNCRGNFNGLVATTGGVSADSHHSWRDTPVHEFAHALGLADEYTELGKCRDPIPARYSPNLDLAGSIEASKWAHWQDSPEVGYWEGGRFCENGVFRPTLISPMGGGRIYDVDYSVVHKEALVLGLASMVEYIQFISPAMPVNPPSSCSDKYTYCKWYSDYGYCTRYASWMRKNCETKCGFCPQNDIEPRIKLNEAVDEPMVFAVTHIQNEEGTIKVSWDLDGVVVGTGDSFTVDASQLAKGRRELTVTVEDTTDLVRKDPENVLRETRTWVLELISAGADLDAIYDCVLPESQIGYVIEVGATLQLCNSNFCEGPSMRGVQCADSSDGRYYGSPTTAGCATSQTTVRLTGCTLWVEPAFTPTLAPTEPIDFVTLTTGHCSDEGRIMDPIICKMAAESAGWKFRGYTNANRFPVGCALYENAAYINNPEQVFVTDKNWPEFCLAEFDASKVAEETTPPDFTNCLGPKLDEEYGLNFGFYVTNEKITFNGKLVGVGSYESGVYIDGAACDASQSEDKMSATLHFDYREACTYNHVQEPSPCVFVITICLPCIMLSEDETEIYQMTNYLQGYCGEIALGCEPIGTEERCSEIATMLGKPPVSRVHSGGVPGGCIYRSAENAVEFNTNLKDTSILSLTDKFCICPAVEIEHPACFQSKDYGHRCGQVDGLPAGVFCTNKGDCCSRYGWCGTSSAHCTRQNNNYKYNTDQCSDTLEASTGSLVESESAIGSRVVANIADWKTTMVYIFAVIGLISTIIILVKRCRNKSSDGFTKIDDVEI